MIQSGVVYVNSGADVLEALPKVSVCRVSCDLSFRAEILSGAGEARDWPRSSSAGSRFARARIDRL